MAITASVADDRTFETPSPTKTIDWPFVLTGCILYALLTFATSLRHEPWRDEADAWLAARDMTIGELFRWSHYSGTPLLWYLVLMPLAKSRLPYVSMQILHATIATITAGIVLVYAPFKKLLRVALCCSYPLGYEFAVVARNYALLALLTVLVAAMFHARYRRPIILGFLLGLMCNASLHGLCLAGAITLALGIEALARRRLRSRVLAGGVLATVGALIAIAQVLPPPADRQNFEPVKAPLARAGFTLQRAAFPLLPADLTRTRPGLIGQLAKAEIITLLAASLAILGALLFSLRRRSLPLLTVLIGLGALECLFVFFYYGGDRHAAILWLGFLATAWIMTREPGTWQLPKFGKILVGASLTFSCAVGAWFHYCDLRYAYSGSTEAGAFLAQALQPSDVVVACSEHEGDCVLPFLPQRRFWYPSHGSFGTYGLYDRAFAAAMQLTPAEAVRRAKAKFPINSQFVFVSTLPLDTSAEENLHLIFKTSVVVFMHGDEQFYVYRGNS